MKAEREAEAQGMIEAIAGDQAPLLPEIIFARAEAGMRQLEKRAMERLLTELGFVKSDTTEDWFAAKRIDCGRAAPDLAELLDREAE